MWINLASNKVVHIKQLGKPDNGRSLATEPSMNFMGEGLQGFIFPVAVSLANKVKDGKTNGTEQLAHTADHINTFGDVK